jgi:hypothetical protein
MLMTSPKIPPTYNPPQAHRSGVAELCNTSKPSTKNNAFRLLVVNIVMIFFFQVFDLIYLWNSFCLLTLD